MLAEATAIQFTSNLDGRPNPVEIDFGNLLRWKVSKHVYVNKIVSV